MNPPNPAKHRIFMDADVLIAGSASSSEYGASLLLLRLAEIILIYVLTSEQIIAEVERDLEEKIPRAIPAFRHLVSRCLDVVRDPKLEELLPFFSLAESKDLPILVASFRESCQYLVTFNTRHYHPGQMDVSILTPGKLILRIRDLLANI